jgi:hypothetical protein
VGLMVIGAALQGAQTRVQGGTSWDVIVLGRIDACWVCQFGPSAQVRYTQALAGKVPSG